MQFDPIKPKLNPSGTKRLKLEYESGRVLVLNTPHASVRPPTAHQRDLLQVHVTVRQRLRPVI